MGKVSWRRVVDMNDRALREITNGLGAVKIYVNEEGQIEGSF